MEQQEERRDRRQFDQWQDEQRQWHKQEFAKLDQLRLQHERNAAKIEFIESELREHKTFVSRAIHEIHDKIEKLNDRFEVLAKQVTGIATKIAMFAVFIGLLSNIVLKQLGLV